MSEINADKLNVFDKMPESELSNISYTQDLPGSSGNTGNTESDFYKTSEHTKQGQQSTGTNKPNDTNGTNNTDDTDAPPKSEKKKGTSLGSLMGGEFAINLMDILLPSLLVMLIRAIGYELDKKELQLNAKERAVLEPAADDVLNAINIDFNNPYVNFAVALSIVYGSKIVDKLPEFKKRKREKETTIAEQIKEIVEKETPVTTETKHETQVSNGKVIFEKWYSQLLKDTVKERRKSRKDCKKWLAENEPTQIKEMMQKCGVTDEKYLNPDAEDTFPL